jgi:two-component system response regulator QseB
MRILLVEDDTMIGEALRKAMRGDGVALDWVRSAEHAETALATSRYDLLLLDLGLPGRDGIGLLRALRARGEAVPVLVLTARDAVSDRVAGLDAGADDYMVKPFALEELTARVRALLRRQVGRPDPVLRHGPIALDPATHEVTLDGAPVSLSSREYALLLALLDRPGAVLSRAQLEERIYGWGQEIGSNAVEVHVHALRRKLGADRIRTVRGVGYTLAQAGGE